MPGRGNYHSTAECLHGRALQELQKRSVCDQRSTLFVWRPLKLTKVSRRLRLVSNFLLSHFLRLRLLRFGCHCFRPRVYYCYGYRYAPPPTPQPFYQVPATDTENGQAAVNDQFNCHIYVFCSYGKKKGTGTTVRRAEANQNFCVCGRRWQGSCTVI